MQLLLSSSSSVWVDRMREPRFSLPNIPGKDCPHVRVWWLPGLCHTPARACGEQSAMGGDSLWSSSGFIPLKAAECGSALSKRQSSLGRCRTGESRGAAGRGWVCVWGRRGGGGLSGYRRGLLGGGLSLRPSLSCLFTCGSISASQLALGLLAFLVSRWNN